VRSARLAQRISQEKLADAVGVSFQQIQKYEKGVNRIGTG
jgi:transcriptional regulator with XRE-family HTH domain